MKNTTAYYHLPGLFEFYELYKLFLKIYREHREFFYEWCEIGSIYGAPSDCIWSGGRIECSDTDILEALDLVNEYGISPRLAFSNSLLREEHLKDKVCNNICSFFEKNSKEKTGIIIYSDLLLDYLKEKYPTFYYISSTTKVITEFDDFIREVNREDYSYVVPDFRLNKQFDRLASLSVKQKDKVEFLCNECCYFGCTDRKKCYENVSSRALGEKASEHICKAPEGDRGYSFSRAMENPGFIGIEDIKIIYLPMGFTNYKIEGRSLGSAMILEFLLYYMTKPEHQLKVREMIYLDCMLDLF